MKLAMDIQEMESRKDRKKELLEDMHFKLKAEIETVMRELKGNQRDVDKLEYEGEENEKDMKSSRDQMAKEVAEHAKLLEEIGELRQLVEDFTRLRSEKRERMKGLQQEQIRCTTRIKEQLDQKGRLEKERDTNVQEIRKLD